MLSTTQQVVEEIEWSTSFSCEVRECPYGCSNPQPSALQKDGTIYCSQCLFTYKRLSKMTPRTPVNYTI